MRFYIERTGDDTMDLTIVFDGEEDRVRIEATGDSAPEVRFALYRGEAGELIQIIETKGLAND